MSDNSNSGQNAVTGPTGATYDPTQSQTNSVGGATGVSNPPDNGAVTASAPTPSDATPAQGITQQGYTPTTPQTTPAAQPGQPPQVTQTAPEPSPIAKKASAWHDAAIALGGGQRYTTTVNSDGSVTRTPIPVSNRHLGLLIAMEALSGAASGLANGQGPGGLGKAAQAGLKQGQQQAQAVQDANDKQGKQAVDDFNLKHQTLEAGLRTASLQQTVAKQAQEVGQANIDANTAMLQKQKDAGVEMGAEGVSEEEASDPTKWDHTKWKPVADSQSPLLDTTTGQQVWKTSTGDIVPPGTAGATPKFVHTYTMVPYNSSVPVKDQDGNPTADTTLIDKWNPGLNLSNAAGTATIPASLYSNKLLHAQALESAQNDLTTAYRNSGANGGQAPDLLAMTKKDPSLKAAVEKFQPLLNANGHLYGPAIKQLANKYPQMAGQIRQLYPQAVTDKLDAKTLNDRAVTTLNASAESGTITAEQAAQIVSAPKGTFTDKAVQAAKAQQTNAVTQKGAEAGAAAQAELPSKEALQNHEHALQNSDAANSADPTKNPLASALVEGTMDPSQLSKRSKSYDATIAAANAYSMQKYGKPFDAAKAAGDYKFATNPVTKNTLNYIGSVQQSGQAVLKQSNAVGNTSFPAANNANNWLKKQTGNTQVTAYYATVKEYADQVAKILQGGGTGSGTSDAKLKQASDLFDTGFTPAQMASTINAITPLLENRKQSMIGNNSYLQRWYPSSGGQQNQGGPAIPTGAVYARDSKGNIGGYVLNNVFHPLGQ